MGTAEKSKRILEVSVPELGCRGQIHIFLTPNQVINGRIDYACTRMCDVTLVFIAIKLFVIIYVFCALVFYLLLRACEGVISSGAEVIDS